MTQKLNTDNGLQGRRTEDQLITAPTKNWLFIASYDSFEVKETLVLRMKFSGEITSFAKPVIVTCKAK